MHAAILVAADRPVRFVTSCTAAYDYFRTLDHLVGIRPFHILPDDPSSPVPTVRYVEDLPRRASFDPATQTLDVAFPWEPDAPDLFDEGEPFHNLVLYPVRLMLERVRQEHGEYTVHASAVMRDGHAIVLSGDAEAGKTTTALNLCHQFGFSLYANDQTVLSTRAGRPWVMHGDQDISLRLSSASRYSSSIANRMFTESSVGDPWEVKRDVMPHELGIGVTSDPVPLRLFIKIRLDDSMDDSVVQLMSSRAVEQMPARTRRALFRMKLELHREMTQTIRGAAFTPLRDADLSLLDLYLPNLDEPRFQTKRSEFLNALFDDIHAAVVSVRGPLDACSRTIVSLFESLSDRTVPA